MPVRVQNASLFPTDLPGAEWTEFPAAGFTVPVTGVIYRHASAPQGMPLGGLGTGFITLGTDGNLDYYSTVFNAFLERYHRAAQQGRADPMKRHRAEIPSLRMPFLGLSVGGRTRVLSLRTPPGVAKAGEIHYWGHYPVVDLEYELDGPLGVGLRAWSPFLPGHSADSNLPGAVFQVFLRNLTQQAQQGTLAFSFHGPRREEIAFNAHGIRQPVTRQVEYRRRRMDGVLTGVVVETAWEDLPYSYALGVIDRPDAAIGGELAGPDWNRLPTGLPEPAVSDGGAAVAIRFALPPGASDQVDFVLGWHAPKWRSMNQSASRTHHDYLHRYGVRFGGAQEVAEHLAAHCAGLLRRILGWQEALYGDARLPGWLKDALVNVFAVLPQESFWLKRADPDHWWGDEGLFVVNESLLSCPQQACIANDSFGEWVVSIFFPDLARNKLGALKHLQRSNGQVPSTLGLGTEPDHPLYDQMLPVDGQVYVHMVDRCWQVTADDSVVTEFYPSVKAQMQFLFLVDQDEDGLPDVFGSGQFYDDWTAMAGAAMHVASYWLATLRIAARLAERAGDGDFAAACRAWYGRAERSIEQKLWNEPVGSYLLYHQPETGRRSDTILADQLAGDCLARLHGLGPVFAKPRVERVLETIWHHNLTPYGLRNAIRPDGTEDPDPLHFLSASLHPTWSCQIPAMLSMYEGEAARGEAVMQQIWRHLVFNLQMPWDMPGGIASDGGHQWGLEYYQNPVLWILPAAMLGLTLRSFCAPRELVNRMVLAAGG